MNWMKRCHEGANIELALGSPNIRQEKNFSGGAKN